MLKSYGIPVRLDDNFVDIRRDLDQIIPVLIASIIFISSLIVHTSVFAMLTVGFDQYLAVLEPLEYATKVTDSVSWQLICFVWTLGGVAATTSSIQLMTSPSPWSICNSNDVTVDSWITLLTEEMKPVLRIPLSVMSLVFYLIPIGLLVFLYVRIFCAATSSSKYIRRSSMHQLQTPPEFTRKYSSNGGGQKRAVGPREVVQMVAANGQAIQEGQLTPKRQTSSLTSDSSETSIKPFVFLLYPLLNTDILIFSDNLSIKNLTNGVLPVPPSDKFPMHIVLIFVLCSLKILLE